MTKKLTSIVTFELNKYIEGKRSLYVNLKRPLKLSSGYELYVAKTEGTDVHLMRKILFSLKKKKKITCGTLPVNI